MLLLSVAVFLSKMVGRWPELEDDFNFFSNWDRIRNSGFKGRGIWDFIQIHLMGFERYYEKFLFLVWASVLHMGFQIELWAAAN